MNISKRRTAVAGRWLVRAVNVCRTAVRTLFGQTSARLQPFLSVLAAAVARLFRRRAGVGAWGKDMLGGDDLTAVDPHGPSPWSAEAQSVRGIVPARPVATVRKRVSSQELFDQIMLEIASGPARQSDRVSKLRASLSGGAPIVGVDGD